MREPAYRKLRSRIVELFGTQTAFASALGKTQQTITAKLNGNSQFSQDDIVDWCNCLQIDAPDVGAYFFAEKLSKT